MSQRAPAAAFQCDHCGAEHHQLPTSLFAGTSSNSMRYHQRHHKKQTRWFTLLQQISLAAIVAVIVSFNFGYLRLGTTQFGSSQQLRATAATVPRRDQWISDAAQPFNQGGVAAETHHLIVVAGHSVTVSGHLEDADEDERDWFLLDYQKNHGLPAAIVGHIRAGIEQAAKDPNSLLVFSGGETRASTGPETEGSSYYRVADAMNLWPDTMDAAGNRNTLRARSVTEEFATDSFQNLLFSICRFYEVTGKYPSKITMVSFTFKQRRFETLHAPSLLWPADRFQYVGVDPPATTGFDLAEATRGEFENAAKPFESDPYGCHSDVLRVKRRERNPFSRTPPYGLSCPDMKELLNYCGPEIIAQEKVPWQKSEL